MLLPVVPLTYSEIMRLLEQLPTSEGDVFCMDYHEQPRNEFKYLTHPEPAHEDTVTVSLEKAKYRNLPTARKRAAELFMMRGLRPYKAFETARCYCWYTQKVDL